MHTGSDQGLSLQVTVLSADYTYCRKVLSRTERNMIEEEARLIRSS
ncbi:hypothetical protein HMPREF1989_01791 [Porphyromonas gingivalis F0566]|nr:hypothetical protein HMPREF1989_01791 [Porphyromonas gingivalis F0566]